MKKTIFLCLMVILSVHLLTAQKKRDSGGKNAHGKYFKQIGLGWNASNLNIDGFNYVIDQFNLNQNIGGAELKEMGWVQGPSVALSFYGNLEETKNLTKIFFELAYTGRLKKLSALDNRTQSLRNINLQMHTAHLGIGTVPVLKRNFDICLGVGFDGGVVNYGSSMGDMKMEKIKSHTVFGASVFAPIFLGTGKDSPLALAIRPYYQYLFTAIDFSDLNEVVNPNTVPQNPEALKSRISNFGVEAQLVIIFGGSRFNW